MDWLDPAAADAAHRSLVLDWLEVQRRFAWHPQALPAACRTDPDPAPALAAETSWRVGGARADERSLARLARGGVRLLPIASPLYPPRLARLVDAPPLLAVRGTLALLRARCVAIVGARACTAYGREIARAFAREWARAGLVVVSGLARGIDACAHEGALAGGGATVAFQACGIDQVYPASHRRLAERIAASGAVVSELPVGAPPRAQHFPLRNRLISASAEAVVVVEARERSGTLVTARHAADQGVDVFAVPGPVGAPASRGPLRLLRDGAAICTAPEDLLGAFGIDVDAAPRENGPPDPAGLAGRIWRRLRDEPCPPDGLARALGEPLPAVRAALGELEVDGRIARDRDGRLRAVRGTGC